MKTLGLLFLVTAACAPAAQTPCCIDTTTWQRMMGNAYTAAKNQRWADLNQHVKATEEMFPACVYNTRALALAMRVCHASGSAEHRAEACAIVDSPWPKRCSG